MRSGVLLARATTLPQFLVRRSTATRLVCHASSSHRNTAKPPQGLLEAGPSKPSSLDTDLRAWIESHGGAIQSCLDLIDNAPCGCRGIVVTRPLSQEEAESIIVVPERLYMTTDDARRLLEPLDSPSPSLRLPALPLYLPLPWVAAKSATNPGAKPLPAVVQLALLLAVERKRGPQSFWSPYIRTLPATPSCAWAMDRAELDAALASLGPVAASWQAPVERARNGVYRQAEVAVQRYGKQLEVETADVVWAMGQVLSRAFGREPHLGMAPYIDLCNHRHGAPRPRGVTEQQEQVADPRVASAGGPTLREVSYAVVDSSSFGEPLALAAGDEVYVSYAADSSDPLAAFLNLGFVPPELLQRQ